MTSWTQPRESAEEGADLNTSISEDNRPSQPSSSHKTPDTSSSLASSNYKSTRNDASTTNDYTNLSLSESFGNIFSAPCQTLIIHACNCEGSWGAGIAAAFRKNYPSAFKIYASHCHEHGFDLFGTALLIPPQKPDRTKNRNAHFVGCLFTSRSKGRKKDSPEQILNATGPAMMDLLLQAREWNSKNADDRKVGEVRMCKINSGLFAVPWDETAAVIEAIAADKGDFEEVRVISREE